jgi:hypothetical protein
MFCFVFPSFLFDNVVFYFIDVNIISQQKKLIITIIITSFFLIEFIYIDEMKREREREINN